MAWVGRKRNMSVHREANGRAVRQVHNPSLVGANGRKLGSVYVFDAGGLVKVGRSVNPADRLKDIQTGNGRLVLAYWAVQLSHAHCCEAERLVHARLRKATGIRMSGEWYYIAPETAVNVIKCVIADAGLVSWPDPVFGMLREESFLLAQLEAQIDAGASDTADDQRECKMVLRGYKPELPTPG